MLNPGFDNDKSAMFSILSAFRTPKPLCENYIIKWTRQGMARDIDQLNNFKVGKILTKDNQYLKSGLYWG